MNSGGIKAFIVTAVGLILGLWVITTAFGSGRNVLASLFVYLPFICGAIGFLQPKVSVYVLFIFGAYAGLLKKFLVLDGRYGFESMYAVLGAPAILLLGACVGTALRMFMRGKVERRELLMMLAFAVLSIIVMGTIYLKQGRPQIAIMGGAYVNVVWVMFMNFRAPSDIRKLKWFTVIVMAASSSVGYYQVVFGLTALDLQYLEYGFVSNLGEFNPDNPRPFATYGSSGQFGWAMVFAVALAAALYGQAKRDREPLHNRLIILLLATILVGAVFCSQKKAPMVGLVVLPFAIVCARSWFAAGASFLLMVSTILFLAFNGDYVSNKLWDWSIELTRIDSNLSLNSFNARIRSFEGMFDPDNVALVGPGNREATSHSLVTDIMLLVGYLPAAAMVLGGLYAFFWSQRRVRKAVGGWKTPLGREVSIYLGFFLSLFAGSAMGTNAYQAFPGSLYWWAAIAFAGVLLHFRVMAMRRAREAAADERRSSMPGPDFTRFPRPGTRPAHSKSLGT